MSFTKTIKEECARNERNEKEVLVAELAAIVRLNGTILMPSFDRFGIRFNTSNYSIARRIFYLIKQISGEEPKIAQVQHASLQKKSLQIVLDHPQAASQLLQQVGLIDANEHLLEKLPTKLLWGPNRSRAFLRGAFLMSGYLSSPEKAHHLEIEAPHLEMAKLICHVMRKFDLTPKRTEKKDSVMIYIKDGEQIAKFLNLIEAFQSLLLFEDARAMKEMRNHINRKINFETANLDKTVNAAMKQVKRIEQLEKEGGFRYLKPELKELARLRIQYPQATLKELGEQSTPKLSKSAVNHRFRKLMAFADDFFEQ